MNERIAPPGSRVRIYRIVGIAVGAAVALVALAVIMPLAATSTPEFFGRYRLLEHRYTNLAESSHEGIACRTCHETDPIKNGLQLIGDFYTSSIAPTDTPVYFRFEPPENEACVGCHEHDWSNDASRTARIPHPAHGRVAEETRPCAQCHKWTAHFETYLPKHQEMPFSGVCVSYGCHVGTKVTDQCFNCHHILHESAEQWDKHHPEVVRTIGQNACLESCHVSPQCQQCHTTGERPEFEGQKIEIGMKAIEELHVKPDWTGSYHGAEALKDIEKCLRCHQSEGECDACHLERPAFHGSTATWIGRHSKQSTAVDDPRCLACHEQPWCEDCHRQFQEME